MMRAELGLSAYRIHKYNNVEPNPCKQFLCYCILYAEYTRHLQTRPVSPKEPKKFQDLRSVVSR